MKGTEHFKQTIKAFLDNKAASDELFAQSYHKPHKNIDDCVTYVLNWVQSTGCSGFSDDEIYCQCIHFYLNLSIIQSRIQSNVDFHCK